MRAIWCALTMVAGWSLVVSDLRAQEAGAPVVISAVCSPTARIWFDDFATEQTGQQRRFSSPPLQAGKVYVYQVKMVQEGQTLEKTVRVRAGDRVTLDFTGDEVREARGEPTAAPAVAPTVATQSYSPSRSAPKVTTLGAGTSNRFGALQQKH